MLDAYQWTNDPVFEEHIHLWFEGVPVKNGHTFLDDAVRTADYTLNNLREPNYSLLKDEGGHDGGLFKGIFIRYFTQLILEEDLAESTRSRYIQFLEHNADQFWEHGTEKNQVLFDSLWNRRPGHNAEIDLTIQLSGSKLIEAAALLQNEGYIK